GHSLPALFQQPGMNRMGQDALARRTTGSGGGAQVYARRTVRRPRTRPAATPADAFSYNYHSGDRRPPPDSPAPASSRPQTRPTRSRVFPPRVARTHGQRFVRPTPAPTAPGGRPVPDGVGQGGQRVPEQNLAVGAGPGRRPRGRPAGPGRRAGLYGGRPVRRSRPGPRADRRRN